MCGLAKQEVRRRLGASISTTATKAATTESTSVTFEVLRYVPEDDDALMYANFKPQKIHDCQSESSMILV